MRISDIKEYIRRADEVTYLAKEVEPGTGITGKNYIETLLDRASRIVLAEREVTLPGLSTPDYRKAIIGVIDEFCERVGHGVAPLYAANPDDVVIVPAHDFPKGFGLDTYIRTGLTAGSKINLIPTGTGTVSFDDEEIIFVLTDFVDLDPDRGIREVYVTADGRSTYVMPVRSMRLNEVPAVKMPFDVVLNSLDVDVYLETGDSVEAIPDGVFVMKYSKYKSLLGF